MSSFVDECHLNWIEITVVWDLLLQYGVMWPLLISVSPWVLVVLGKSCKIYLNTSKIFTVPSFLFSSFLFFIYSHFFAPSLSVFISDYGFTRCKTISLWFWIIAMNIALIQIKPLCEFHPVFSVLHFCCPGNWPELCTDSWPGISGMRFLSDWTVWRVTFTFLHVVSCLLSLEL